MKRIAAIILLVSLLHGLTLSTIAYVGVDYEQGGPVVFGYDNTDQEETARLIREKPIIPRQMEYLDRGAIATATSEGMFISWRWLAWEPLDIRFNVYRNGKLLNPIPLDITNFLDTAGMAENVYTVTAIVNGVEGEHSVPALTSSKNYHSIPLRRPAPWTAPDGRIHTYWAENIATGDLDGDGQYELVVEWVAGSADNSQFGFTGPMFLDAFKLDGTFMWRISLGINLRSGAHFTNCVVYDLDGDGRAEIALRTSDGTVDGEGKAIGSMNADYREPGGIIVTGNEFLTVFDGETGAAIITEDYAPSRGHATEWGDGMGNRSDRFKIAVAYLDGVHPSIITARGIYGRTGMAAWNFDGEILEQLWKFDTNDYPNEDPVHPFRYITGQGAHTIAIADVDFDGRDNIVYGGLIMSPDGKPMFGGYGHGDALHVGDLDPDRPGLEIFRVQEYPRTFGCWMADARTGDMIWGQPAGDTPRGAAADVNPLFSGDESWAAGRLFSAKGEVIIGGPRLSVNFANYWDGDLLREILDGIRIDKYDWRNNTSSPLLVASGTVSNNGTKAVPGLQADIMGDWREEVIWREKDSTELRIYSTTIPTDYRFFTLMHDPIYRMGVVWQNVAYSQPPHTGYNLGYHMKKMPLPEMYAVKHGTFERYESGATMSNREGYPIKSLVRSHLLSFTLGKEAVIVNNKTLSVDLGGQGRAEAQDNKIFVPMKFVEGALRSNDLVHPSKADRLDDDKIIVTLDGTEMEFEVGRTTYNFFDEPERRGENADTRKLIPGGNCDAPYIEKETETLMLPLQPMIDELGYHLIRDGDLVIISDQELKSSQVLFAFHREQLENATVPSATAKSISENPKLRPNQLTVVGVYANGDDGNAAIGAVDNDITTRWNCWGNNAQLQVELYDVRTVDSFAMLFYGGGARSYNFDILVSMDEKEWKPVLTGAKSSGRSNDMESFPIEPVQAKYVKYVGHGFGDGGIANNIFEFMILGDNSEDPKVEIVDNYTTAPSPLKLPFGSPLKIINAIASNSPEPNNIPKMAFDGNNKTRWSSKGPQSITFELEEEGYVQSVGMLSFMSHLRMQVFSVELSADGVAWTTVLDGFSSGQNDEMEYYFHREIKSKYIRLNVFGNSAGDWNHIVEFGTFGRK